MADSAVLQNHLGSIIKGINEGHHDQVLRSSEQYLAVSQDEDILFCKVMALVQQNKLTQALQVINNFKKQDEKSKFLKAYICYRLADYKEALTLAESTMNDTKMTVLKSQIQCKRENYEHSCNILAGLIQENKEDIKGIYEDLVANFFNSLALYTWSSANNKKQIQLNNAIKAGLMKSLKYCSTEFSKITLREVYLNLCILLAIDTTFGAGIFSNSEFKSYSREFLTKFEAILKKDSENHMDIEVEEGKLSEREKDRLISKVIEVIFDRKNNRIKVIDEDISRLEKDYFKLGEEDIFLKTSVLSYLIFMKMNTGNTAEMHVMTKEIDGIVAVLKKSKLTKKMQEIVHTNLLFNKSITLLLRGKFQDVKDLELSNDIWDNLSIKAYVYTKNKKVDSVLDLSSEVSQAQSKDKFLLNLLQIASFHMLNNQSLYVEKFVEFMNNSVLPEFNTPNLFQPDVYREFFNGMVKYIFKNTTLLGQMSSSVKDLVMYFEDVDTLHNIAENFASKKDFLTSEQIYKRVLEIDPTNEKATRKSQHFLAMRDPNKVNYEDLPKINLITENEKLRSLEVDFMQYKNTLTRATSRMSIGGASAEVSRVIRKSKKKLKKIRWPKNFDKTNPGPMPDAERWVHKLERVKGKKKGYMTATQGSSNVNTTATRATFQQGPSTANVDAVTSSTKPSNKKGKKK